MKNLITITILVLLLTLFSCNRKRKPIKQTVKTLAKDTLQNKDENAANIINYDSTIVLKNIYVINREGTDIKQRADIKALTIGTYDFGKKLEVIEETEEWYGVRERITRDLYYDDKYLHVTRWEKVYVLKINTGTVTEIFLLPSEINIISSMMINDKIEYFDQPYELKKYLKMELIEEIPYKRQLNNAVNFFFTDTLNYTKKNRILTFSCHDTSVIYQDIPYDIGGDANTAKYSYLGQFEFLNAYLIHGSYWEHENYILIDKTNCNEKLILNGFPIISPDKKHIVSIIADVYDSSAGFELYELVGEEIHHLMSLNFTNWMPLSDSIFWSTDGYLYMAVNHIKSYWTENGRINNKCQYLRIKVLQPTPPNP